MKRTYRFKFTWETICIEFISYWESGVKLLKFLIEVIKLDRF